MESIENVYADDFLAYKASIDSTRNINASIDSTRNNVRCIEIHKQGTQSILDQSTIKKDTGTDPRKTRGGANGTIMTYPSGQFGSNEPRTILMKFRKADTISSSYIKTKLKIVDELQDPTQYEMVNAILLEFYFNYKVSLGRPTPQFTKILTCSQSVLPDQSDVNLETVLFVESIPGKVQSLMSYLREKKSIADIEGKIFQLMLDLYDLGNKIGFWHGDLHAGNILIKESDQSLMVIDLGRAYIHPNILSKLIPTNTLNNLLKNACAKLWPCEHFQTLTTHIENVTVETVYDHILRDTFRGRYSYFNRHGHLAECQKNLDYLNKHIHPDVLKSVVLADIGGLALSIFSKSYEYIQYKDKSDKSDNGMRCSLEGLKAMLRAYMPPTESDTWSYKSTMHEEPSSISIFKTFIKVIQPIGLLERIYECQNIIESVPENLDSKLKCLKEMSCLWVLLYVCITNELLAELPAHSRILSISLYYSVSNIIKALTSIKNSQSLDDDLIKYAFFIHGQPEMFTCDMFRILHDLWEIVARDKKNTQGGGKKRTTVKPPKRIVLPVRSIKRNMQRGGVDANVHKTVTNTFEDAVLDALNYKPMSPSDNKRPIRNQLCESPQTCAAEALGNMQEVPTRISVIAGGTKSKIISKKKTSEKYRYKQREYVVYEGSRGGRYIRIKGEYVSIRTL